MPLSRTQRFRAREDDWPLFVVSKACEVFGLRQIEAGKPKAYLQTTEALWAAGEKGFKVLSAGPDSARSFLRSLQRDHGRNRSGHNRDLGSIYSWLNASSLSSDYEPIKALVRTYIFENYPLVANAKIIGGVLKDRQLYPIDRASRHLGVKIALFELALLEMGLAKRGTQTEGVDPKGFVRADQLGRISREITNLAPESIARERLSMSERMFRSFVEHDFFNPRRHEGLSLPRFSLREMDEFLAELFSSARVLWALHASQCTLKRATMIARCPAADIVNLIINNRLRFVGRLRAGHGIQALVVDPQEVREELRKKPGPERTKV